MTTQDGPVLVIGATGQQGGAVARELLAAGREVHAFTRAVDSPAARRLAGQGARLVRGDLDEPESIRAAVSTVQAVFSVQPITGGPEVEVRQGKAVAEAAKEAGVEHVVYSSVFATHERPEAVDGTLIVRFALPRHKPLQMIATADIGAFAADAFAQPEDHIGEALALAGDELTGTEIAEAFHDATGMPARFEQRPLAEIRAISDDLALMLEWLDRFGYKADIAALRARQPRIRTLRAWLQETTWQPAAHA